MLGLIKNQCLKRIFSDKTSARLLLLLRNVIFHNSVLTTSLREKTRIGKTAKITAFKYEQNGKIHTLVHSMIRAFGALRCN